METETECKLNTKLTGVQTAMKTDRQINRGEVKGGTGSVAQMKICKMKTVEKKYKKCIKNIVHSVQYKRDYKYWTPE